MNKERFGKYSGELEKYTSRSKRKTMGLILALIAIVTGMIGSFMPFTSYETVVVVPYVGRMLSGTLLMWVGALGALLGLWHFRYIRLSAKV